MLYQVRRGLITGRGALDVTPAAGAADFIGSATVLDHNYAPGNITFTANGGTNLPACLFVCSFATNDVGNPSTFQIGATSLAKVSSDSSNAVQLWAAVYAGGSDTVTVGDGSSFDIMAMATGWSTKSLIATAVSPQSRTYGSADATAAAHMTLSSACVIPTSGIGFVVGVCLNAALCANDKNWANVESSPVPNDFFLTSNAHVTLACKSTAGSWSPEFWGSTNATAGGYGFGSGLAACGFGP